MAHPRIDGRYDIKELLGLGGMGIVYKAYDFHRKGYVALKTMKDSADPAALELFAQEWRTLANISHPNIVDVLNSGEFEEEGQRKPYFVMPLLPGKTLDHLIRDAGHRLRVERVVEILFQTCRGLQAAHAGGLIHRDLKPSNLFVMNDDSVKIIDFGMVHLADARRSVTGIKGTLQYMAPEQVEMKEITAATDIFSLGVVAYESLTGRKPFDRGSEAGIVLAIRSEFPPPVSDLNPAVSKVLAQVVAKAMAKGPWNRFESARDFGENLQRALKREPIELFDLARIQPRVERARRALGEGDFEYADEILNELQLEGHVDPQITRLLEEVSQATRGKVIRQLLESAQTRMKEEEFPLAWQKVQEALQKDPGNREAQALQAEIETRRNDQQMDKWRRLVHQHLHNQAFTQARQAIDEIRKAKPDDLEVAELTAEAERREQEFRKACDEKEQYFQSAMRAYSSGEISTALSRLERILELDGRTPGFSVPGRDELYRETYNKIRSERDAVQHAVAEIERNIAAGNIARAEEISTEQATRYPNDLSFQALKLKVADLLRQEKSAYIAEIGRRVDAEPDLDRSVKCLEEALERYPKEPHIQELAESLGKRRNLVNSIVLKARQYEEQNLVSEALSQWNTLRSVYPQYPGLDFEIERVQKRLEQRRREEEKLNWVDKIDRLLQAGEHDRAHDLAVEALSEFPGDQELQSLRRLALEGRERGNEAVALMDRALALCSGRQFAGAIELLRKAAHLDPNSATVRTDLANALVGQAQVLIADDWRAAEPLLQEALRIAPAHALGKSLRPSLLLAKRMEFVDQCVAQAREHQAAGDIPAAIEKVQEGLVSYPNDGRLIQLQNTLRNAITEQVHLLRNRDLEELRQLLQEAEQNRDQTTLTAVLEKTVVLTRLHPDDPEFSKVASAIEQCARVAASARPVDEPVLTVPAPPPPPIPPPSAAPAPDSGNLPKRTPAETVSGLQTQLGSAWTRLRSEASSLQVGARLRLLFSQLGTGWGGLSAAKRAGLVTMPLVILGLILFAVRPKPKPLPAPAEAVSVAFTVNLEGARIAVDGLTLTGATTKLTPGEHSVTASKEGYKTIEERFKAESGRAPVELQLEPEPDIIRVSAEVPGAKVVLDGKEIGPIQDGVLSYNLSGGGAHSLKLVQGGNEVFSIQFLAEPGAPARLVERPKTRDLPIIVVSNLGARAVAYSSVKEMRVALKTGDPQDIPQEGRDLNLSTADNEVTFDDGRRPASFPVEIGNAPVLSIRAGASTKGILYIEANADGARVYLNGLETPGSIQRGKWSRQLDPGDYKIRLSLDGYEDSGEQTLTVVANSSAKLKFEMKQAVTSAFVRIVGGTPEAEVWVDERQIGTLDSAGSLAPMPVAAGVDHTVRLHKTGYDDFEAKRRAPMKEAIVISAAEARLKALGTLAFEIQPPEAQVTIHQQGEPARKITEKVVSLREGTYIVNGALTGYEPFDGKAQAVSGQRVNVLVKLVRKEAKEQPRELPPPPKVELTELFGDSENWKLDSGFSIHDGSTWLKDPHFEHIFDILKIKKSLGRQERIRWRIYLDAGDHYIECELDGSNYSRRIVMGGKASDGIKIPHKSTQKDFYRLEIAVTEEEVVMKVGEATDKLSRKVTGRTVFDGKFGLKLVK